MSYLEEQFGLRGSVAVIAGGGGTLCGAIAGGFLKAGARVALWGHREATLAAKKRELVADGADAEAIGLFEVDLLEEARVAAGLKATVAAMGEVKILVNGVGGSSVRTPLVEADTDEFERVVKLNLVAGCFLPTKIFAAYWVARGIGGRILNIASMGSYVPLSGGWAYSAAKAAVINQTMAQARELAKFGIRVNAVAPGFFLGKQNQRLLQNADGALTQRGKDVLAHTPAGRFGQPAELCAAAIFLCSRGADFVTGATLPIDGGYLCHGI
jgi:NAD(P)-dependent dehydrogenase (short-subunit alcohol dehydrogenase family)